MSGSRARLGALVVTLWLGAAGATPTVRPYPSRDLRADRTSRTQVNGQAVEVRTLVTRDDPARVAVWYLSALHDDGWTAIGSKEPPKIERVDGDTLRVRAHAPLAGTDSFAPWFALADGAPAAPPLVVVEISRPAHAKTSTVRIVQPADLRPDAPPPEVPAGIIPCAACELESVIRQPGAVVAVYTGPGGVATGVERVRAGAARGGWAEAASDRGLPAAGSHTLSFQRGAQACFATVSPGPSSWRFRAGVICESP